MIQGLFEAHINVINLDRSIAFYEHVLGLQLGRKEEDRRAAFFWVGGRGEAMLGLWEVPAERVIAQHFAFRSALEDVQRAAQYLQERGLQGHNFLNDGSERPMVFGWMPALALYFSDPDGHSLEFIAMLPDPPRPELGVVSLEHWQRAQTGHAASRATTQEG
jgi:lactoylglutathione lyase